MRRSPFFPGLALIAIVSSTHAVHAQPQGTLYLATAGDNQGNLYTVDPTTATPTLVGPVNIGANNAAITGLAFHPMTGVLYGVTANISSTDARSLVTINPANGNATLIGSLGSASVVDISFSSDGTLYGWQKNTGGTIRGSLGRTSLLPISDRLVTINPSTGAATPLGNPGIVSTQGGGLAFVLGTLYLSVADSNGALRTVDPATGLTTVGPTMNGDGGKISAMSASPTGVLFAINGQSNLVTINTATGAVTTVGTLTGVSGGDALAFVGSAIGTGGASFAEIPALGTVGLVVLGLLLTGAGIFLSRAR